MENQQELLLLCCLYPQGDVLLSQDCIPAPNSELLRAAPASRGIPLHIPGCQKQGEGLSIFAFSPF